MEPDNIAHNVAHAVRIPVELDMPAFQRAFEKLVDRHPVLRTTFAAPHSEPVQRVHAYAPICFQVQDALGWSETRLNDELAQEVYRPFGLERGPLMRVNLFSLSPRDHLLLLVVHHIVTDMWSLALLMHETTQLYAAEQAGQTASLKPFRAQYADHVNWEAEMLAGPEGERLWAYWREQLAGELPVLNLPTDRPRPPVQTDRGALESLRLGVELTQALKSLSKARGVTLYTTLLAAFQVLLYRYTGQTDILVGSPKARRRREVARTMGYFINPVVLRADLSETLTFMAFLDQVHRTVQGAFEHDAFPFSLLVERLQPGRDLSRPPIFQAMFSWQKTTRLVDTRRMSSLALGEDGKGRMNLAGLVLEAVTLGQRPTPFDWTLLIAETQEEMGATVEYNSDLFLPDTIRRMLRHYRTLLESIVADPGQRVSDLPLLAEDERRQMLVEWNDTLARYPQDDGVQRLFEAQVERTPDAVALAFEGQALTYRALNRRANQLARRLQKLGVGPETLVGISVERSVEMVLGVLGVLKAGGAYLPLDLNYPRERLAFMLRDAQVPVLLTQTQLIDRLPNQPANQQTIQPTTICLDADWEHIAVESDANPESGVTPENLAYVIYTSGSTGQPKGVLLRQRGLCNLVNAQVRAFGVDSGSRVLQFASFSFDAAVSEIFMALLTGATLHLVRRETLLSISDLVQTLRDMAITTVTLPPSLLSLLPADDLTTLKTVVSAGESCSWDVAARWSPGRRFVNAYGPTEATIGPLLHQVAGVADGASVPIGRPIANTRAYVLDRRLQPSPVGVPGELHIGGVGLARGYLEWPELTAEKFIPAPSFAPPLEEGGARLYKTGDLARYRPDGSVEFLGRADHQVKVRGFRIELGEIEALLKGHASLRDAVVVAREVEGKSRDPLSKLKAGKRLVAYVMPEQGSAATFLDSALNELRIFLKTRLPEYMVPSLFVVIDALPLTPNGKVDRGALPIPAQVRPDLAAAFVKPRNELERTIAAIWQEVLGVDKVGVHDNFFDLGGHSLMVTRVHRQLQQTFKQNLSMVEMFKYPTISALAEFLSRETETQPVFQDNVDRAGRQKQAIRRQKQHLKGVAHKRAVGRSRR
jgi:amino acid adenylation domain-containing protein